jgi:hypothetical protein
MKGWNRTPEKRYEETTSRRKAVRSMSRIGSVLSQLSLGLFQPEEYDTSVSRSERVVT